MKSDFWIERNENESTVERLERLTKSCQTVANFVHIVTGKNIPVRIKGQDSYTDGKAVTISADVKPEELDVTVGLALHEGSHILLTDFTLLPNLAVEASSMWKGYDKKYDGVLKNILNVVEDRRIDNFINTTAKGYSGYYLALYKKYFFNEVTTKGLLAGSYTTETVDNYMFHIINFTNKNRQLDQLKGLQDIWKIFDLANISRLKTTKDALQVSVDILQEILKHVAAEDTGEQKSTPQPGKGKGQPLTDHELRELLEAFEKQKDFLDHGMEDDKTELSGKEAAQIKAMGEAGVEMSSIGKEGGSDGYNTEDYGEVIPQSTAIIVKKITRGLINSGLINGLSRSPINTDAVREGIQMGNKSAHKLTARQETKTLTTTRLKNGRIDGRLINQLGYGNAEIFKTTSYETANEAHIHMSIDASGSMSGTRIHNAIKTAVAIAHAASKIQGISCVIDFRHQTSDNKPCVIIGYDSRTQKPSQLKLIEHVNTEALTPEGLCYEAIMDYMVKSGTGIDSYLINFSDGEPYFSIGGVAYDGGKALRHTAQQIKKIKQMGIQVLSYFIGYDTEPCDSFKTMYGKDAVGVDTNNVMQVAKTVNKLLMK